METQVSVKTSCADCREMTTRAILRGGLCPPCHEVTDAAAALEIEITLAMMAAGSTALEEAANASSFLKASAVFQAMVRALPMTQKRALIRSLAPSQDL